jgi:hypothetical protein
MTNNYDYDLTCPYCNMGGGYSDFPDLFYADIDYIPALNEQYELLQQLWTKGFNIVTCGNCGQVFIHKTEH